MQTYLIEVSVSFSGVVWEDVTPLPLKRFLSIKSCLERCYYYSHYSETVANSH